MRKKVVIVGGVAGGATTAVRLRRLDEKMEIVLFERGDYISFANCGLPYHIGGVIKEREQLLIRTEEDMKKRYRVDVRTGAEVTRIDRKHKQVEVVDRRRNKTYVESYDILVLSPGASPVRPNLPGFDSRRLYTLRNMADMDAIIRAMEGKKSGHVVVAGGGFTGLEMAENLVRRNFAVTLVEQAEQVMPGLDREMAAIVHEELRNNRVSLYLNDGIAAVSDEKEGVNIILKSGKKLSALFAVLAIGVRPETKLAKDAGLLLGKSGGILVGKDLRTSDPDIFAIGDAVELPVLHHEKEKIWLPLAGPANRQGRLAADIIAGKNVFYDGGLGTMVVKVFDLTVASTGSGERTLIDRGISFKSVIVHPNDHAGYYPGARPLTIKLLFDENGKVLGAQAAGYQGVEKRIDVIAASMYFGAAVSDLAALELAYAPPYSSAKDPVNVAGYVAGNILQGDVDVVTWDRLGDLDPSRTFILDVREPAERLTGSIENSVNIPLGDLRDRLDEIPRNKTIVVYCAVGLRAYIACRILKQNGYSDVRNLSGGFRTYSKVTNDLAMAGASNGTPVKELEEIAPAAEEGENNMRLKVNACGLQCPGPILQLYSKMQSMEDGQEVEITATDPGFLNDVRAWASRTGNTVLSAEKKDDRVIAVIRKGSSQNKIPQGTSGQDKTIVVFSGDLDKAIASFIIANGAAAMGRKVTMFFTFWGLNILRRRNKVKVKKGILDKMFGLMLPRGSNNLGLSRLNMLGIGPRMIRFVMRKKNISSLEDLIIQSRMAGINLVACRMSMDVMGIKPEELIEGVEIGGVASYLAAAEEGNVNLFI